MDLLSFEFGTGLGGVLRLFHFFLCSRNVNLDFIYLFFFLGFWVFGGKMGFGFGGGKVRFLRRRVYQ